jgi:hypothetical protein
VLIKAVLLWNRYVNDSHHSAAMNPWLSDGRLTGVNSFTVTASAKVPQKVCCEGIAEPLRRPDRGRLAALDQSHCPKFGFLMVFRSTPPPPTLRLFDLHLM